jgi:hypothetical protein
MKQRALAGALVLALGLGATAPALANGAAVVRNLTLFGAAAGVLITNYTHKLRERHAQQQEVRRRQAAYRDWYYHKYGYYPTQEQSDQWYKQTYGVNPQRP